MTIREKVHNIELYLPPDKEIWEEQQGIWTGSMILIIPVQRNLIRETVY